MQAIQRGPRGGLTVFSDASGPGQISYVRMGRGGEAGLGADGRVGTKADGRDGSRPHTSLSSMILFTSMGGRRGGSCQTSGAPLPPHLLVLNDPVLVKIDEEDVAGHQAALLDDLVVRDIHHADLKKGQEDASWIDAARFS